ncbi:hypothetical protein AG0111_0g334 [Alternaria gaisen]|uniref:Uncharacterized protein n=1 Tax=Alternaria gaisen TaxID=167740 RepID=A0ACB6FZB5_9PLEO|nr:hypothetical protein AG0111_0g334 [Alternaria gaisen]
MPATSRLLTTKQSKELYNIRYVVCVDQLNLQAASSIYHAWLDMPDAPPSRKLVG